MSFYQDFIEKVDHQIGVINALARTVGNDRNRVVTVDAEDGTSQRVRLGDFVNAMMPFIWAAHAMHDAKIVRLRGDQAQVFLETPETPGQDYVQWLRLIFPSVYLHIDGPLHFTDYTGGIAQDIAENEARGHHGEVERLRIIQREANPPVKGVILRDVNPDDHRVMYLGPGGVEAVGRATDVAGPPPRLRALLQREQESEGLTERIGIPTQGTSPLRLPVPHGSVERIINITFLLPIPGFMMNLHACSLIVLKDGQLLTSVNSQMGVRERMRQWAVHVINFLSSPSVKLLATSPDPALQKARARRGKPPLPSWYEISWRHVIKDYDRHKVSKQIWHHSFRYDVRAHPRRISQGRIVWIPAHMRGLRNELYRPAVRVIPPKDADQP